MTVRVTAITVALAAALVSGCGTTANVFDSMLPGHKLEPYGGVKYDWKKLQEVTRGPDAKGPNSALAVKEDKFERTLAISLDLPFSFVGDTLTLPFAFGSLVPNLTHNRGGAQRVQSLAESQAENRGLTPAARQETTPTP